MYSIVQLHAVDLNRYTAFKITKSFYIPEHFKMDIKNS